jgi:mono/diheme cytochrome c family protein
MALRGMTTGANRIGIIACCGASLLVAGCGVSHPGQAESAVMTWLKHKVTVGNRSDRNPLGHGPMIAQEGRTAFDSYCMVCHGLDGQNTGVPFANQISPPIPSLASKQVQEYTDGQLKWIIENGVSPSGMPASRGILSDEEIWEIVEYLRHLPPTGSLGEPGVYTGACTAPPNQSFAPETPQSRPTVKRGKRGSQQCAHS